MDSEKIVDLLSKELVSATEEMSKTEVLEQKVQLSKLIVNLTETLNVFSSMPGAGFQATDINEDDEIEINDLLDEKLG